MTAVEEEVTEWVPGVPLYRRENHSNSLYLFNFRESSEDDHCVCSDAASWPNPRPPHDLDRFGPSVERFIADFRAWAAAGWPA